VLPSHSTAAADLYAFFEGKPKPLSLLDRIIELRKNGPIGHEAHHWMRKYLGILESVYAECQERITTHKLMNPDLVIKRKLLKPFRFANELGFQHRTLRRLAYLLLFSVADAANDVRAKRLYKSNHIRVQVCAQLAEKPQYTCKVSHLPEAIRLPRTLDDFQLYVIIPDSRGGLFESSDFKDMTYMHEKFLSSQVIRFGSVYAPHTTLDGNDSTSEIVIMGRKILL